MPHGSEYHLGYYFFAPQGRFKPCGMFTADHIVATLICITIVASLLIFFRKSALKLNKLRLIRTGAVTLSILEIIKISHSFIYGDYYLDAWFPLSYCGLFIFALWMAGYGKNRLKQVGEAFIVYGCPFAGMAFLVFPTTSLMIFPIWHYFSLYSMFYHSLMIFVGITLLLNEPKLDKNSFVSYAMFVITFAIPAIIMNSIFECNLMNLREPYNIPIQPLQNIYSNLPTLYTVLVVIVYMCIPFITLLFTRKKKQ